ncbi:hypothetical protein V1272_000897 [Bradyrhizobium sp. AZCC 1708]
MVGISCRITIRTITSMPVRPRSQDARQAAGLALQMKAQRQFVHVNEGDVGEFAHRMHGDAGEDAVAKLRQHRHKHPHRAVACGHQQWRGDQPQHPVRGLDRCRAHAVERIDRPFEGERHRQRRELRREQQHHRPDDAHFQVRAVAGPDIGPQVNQRPDQGRLFGSVVGRQLGDIGVRIRISHRCRAQRKMAHRPPSDGF